MVNARYNAEYDNNAKVDTEFVSDKPNFGEPLLPPWGVNFIGVFFGEKKQKCIENLSEFF